jgi:hypothetical protein
MKRNEAFNSLAEVLVIALQMMLNYISGSGMEGESEAPIGNKRKAWNEKGSRSRRTLFAKPTFALNLFYIPMM